MRPPRQQPAAAPAPPPGLPTLKQRVDAMRLAARFHLRRRRRHHSNHHRRQSSSSSSSLISSSSASVSKNHYRYHHHHHHHDDGQKSHTVLPTTVRSLVRGLLLPRGAHRAKKEETKKEEDDEGSSTSSRTTTRSYQVLVKWWGIFATNTKAKETTIPKMISFTAGVDHHHDHVSGPYSKVPSVERLI